MNVSEGPRLLRFDAVVERECLTAKMKALRFFETSVTPPPSTRRFVPGDRQQERRIPQVSQRLFLCGYKRRKLAVLIAPTSFTLKAKLKETARPAFDLQDKK